MADSEIAKVIKGSFLSEEQKNGLLEYLKSKGGGILFFGMFNDYLKKAIINEGVGLKKTIKEIDGLEEGLEDRITSEKERIEENMEKELSNLGPEDKKTKNKIWSEYYNNLERLGANYERGVQEILSKIAPKI
ncbi:MAG: hypothetical protein HZA94_00410 [Candidatus Vogelbacteria bacterium]|nr:hypothetical protein [Candidatus Vogelbacteria bacterium]